MHISELIERLERIKDMRGDILVGIEVYTDGEDAVHEVEAIVLYPQFVELEAYGTRLRK